MPTLSDKELEESLAGAGNSLLQPPSAADELMLLLDKIDELLSKVEQSPTKSMQNALCPLMNALVMEKLLNHSDDDVKVGVASCLSEIIRITAPAAPYDDDTMKDILQLIVSSFENLSDASSKSHEMRISILEIVAKVRCCVIMLDLEFDQMIIEMFQHFLKAIRPYHDNVIFESMETIMSRTLEESEDISSHLLSPILATLRKNNEAVLPVATKLAERVIQNTADKIRPYLAQAVKSLDASLGDFSEVVPSLCGEISGIGGHTIECNSKDQQMAKDGIGETDSKDEDPAVVRFLGLIERDSIHENTAEEIIVDKMVLDDSNHQLDAKAISDTELDDHVVEKSVELEAKLKKAEDQQVSRKDEAPGKDVCISAAEVNSVIVAKSIDEVKEIQPSESEAPENEAADVASPTQSDNIPYEDQSEEDSLEKRKENLVSGERVIVDTAKAFEGEYISVAKKQRRSGRKQAAKTVAKGRKLTDNGASPNEDGNTSDSVAKMDTFMSLKATRDQGNQEETTRVNSKRKRTPGTNKAVVQSSSQRVTERIRSILADGPSQPAEQFFDLQLFLLEYVESPAAINCTDIQELVHKMVHTVGEIGANYDGVNRRHMTSKDELEKLLQVEAKHTMLVADQADASAKDAEIQATRQQLLNRRAELREVILKAEQEIRDIDPKLEELESRAAEAASCRVATEAAFKEMKAQMKVSSLCKFVWEDHFNSSKEKLAQLDSLWGWLKTSWDNVESSQDR